MDATVVDVAMKYWAVGVVVALTAPLLPTARRELVIPVRLSTPAELNDDVAEPPKYAVSNTERSVDDARVRAVRPLTVKLDAEVCVGLKVPVTVKLPTTVEDAAIEPPVSVERPLTFKVPTVAVLPFRVVEVAVPKVPTPVTVSVPMLAVFAFPVVDVDVVKKPVVAVMAVDDAYGNVEASVVDVAMKYCAVGVVVATTTPLPFAVRIEFVIEFNVSVPARASAPALEKVEVAEPPK